MVNNIVSEINKEKINSVIEIPNDYFVNEKLEMLDNGQSLTAYYKQNRLKKIVHFAGISHQNKITEYYFNKNSLVFILEKIYRIQDKNGFFKNSQLYKENRYYFHNGSIFKYIGESQIDQYFQKNVGAFFRRSEKFQEE